jgi:hypothetical protein
VTTKPAAGLSANREDVDAATLGAEGNERLTAWAGAALLVGFGVECLTLLNVHWWLTAHMLIGIAVLVPTVVKGASTMYRFAKYYTNDAAYVRKGPPKLLLRIIGPFLLLNTFGVLLTGILIPLAGSYRWRIEQLHKLGTWTWAALIAVHVLYYLWRVPGLILADLAGRGTLRSAAFQRIAAVAVACVAGMGLALVLMPWVRDWIAHH